ncbi:ribosome silencing factor [Spirochaeta cellobiosiphila]|uniref:ribosome silencing factor n=1 Tax=Spirochaeta cellobiosiphila TaxID=504483 RepID=UPI0003FFD2A2|nr:ribosome silencing factor [Spirochaeta cellobiosiphila]
MEDMLNKTEVLEISKGIALFLDDNKAEDIVTLDVSGKCSWADIFIVASVNSQGQLRGLVDLLNQYFKKNNIKTNTALRKLDITDWVLLDCDPIIIHLMEKKTRQFYEIENLWFEAERL